MPCRDEGSPQPAKMRGISGRWLKGMQPTGSVLDNRGSRVEGRGKSLDSEPHVDTDRPSAALWHAGPRQSLVGQRDGSLMPVCRPHRAHGCLSRQGPLVSTRPFIIRCRDHGRHPGPWKDNPPEGSGKSDFCSRRSGYRRIRPITTRRCTARGNRPMQLVVEVVAQAMSIDRCHVKIAKTGITPDTPLQTNLRNGFSAPVAVRTQPTWMHRSSLRGMTITDREVHRPL